MISTLRTSKCTLDEHYLAQKLVPEQNNGIIERTNQQVRVIVPINIPACRKGVAKSPENRGDRAASDHLYRGGGGVTGVSAHQFKNLHWQNMSAL